MSDKPIWICPKCKSETLFITATCIVESTPYGCELAQYSGYEWSDDSFASCDCGWEGSAGDAAEAAQEVSDVY